MFINEVELSIYSFLTSGAKKSKSNLDQSSWGSTGSLAIGALNAWQMTITLDQTLIRKIYPSIVKKGLLEEKEGFLYLSTEME